VLVSMRLTRVGARRVQVPTSSGRHSSTSRSAGLSLRQSWDSHSGIARNAVPPRLWALHSALFVVLTHYDTKAASCPLMSPIMLDSRGASERARRDRQCTACDEHRGNEQIVLWLRSLFLRSITCLPRWPHPPSRWSAPPLRPLSANSEEAGTGTGTTITRTNTAPTVDCAAVGAAWRFLTQSTWVRQDGSRCGPRPKRRARHPWSVIRMCCGGGTRRCERTSAGYRGTPPSMRTVGSRPTKGSFSPSRRFPSPSLPSPPVLCRVVHEPDRRYKEKRVITLLGDHLSSSHPETSTSFCRPLIPVVSSSHAFVPCPACPSLS